MWYHSKEQFIVFNGYLWHGKNVRLPHSTISTCRGLLLSMLMLLNMDWDQHCYKKLAGHIYQQMPTPLNNTMPTNIACQLLACVLGAELPHICIWLKFTVESDSKPLEQLQCKNPVMPLYTSSTCYHACRDMISPLHITMARRWYSPTHFPAMTQRQRCDCVWCHNSSEPF